MTADTLLPLARFLPTLEIVRREARHLHFNHQRLFAHPIDADWVRKLESAPELAEQMEAFISRYGRMQDTIADKLLPRWLMALAERPGRPDRGAQSRRTTRRLGQHRRLAAGAQAAQSTRA